FHSQQGVGIALKAVEARLEDDLDTVRLTRQLKHVACGGQPALAGIRIREKVYVVDTAFQRESHDVAAMRLDVIGPEDIVPLLVGKRFDDDDAVARIGSLRTRLAGYAAGSRGGRCRAGVARARAGAAARCKRDEDRGARQGTGAQDMPNSHCNSSVWSEWRRAPAPVRAVPNAERRMVSEVLAAEEVKSGQRWRGCPKEKCAAGEEHAACAAEEALEDGAGVAHQRRHVELQEHEHARQ